MPKRGRKDLTILNTSLPQGRKKVRMTAVSLSNKHKIKVKAKPILQTVTTGKCNDFETDQDIIS
jgi:hypothetical protein